MTIVSRNRRRGLARLALLIGFLSFAACSRSEDQTEPPPPSPEPQPNIAAATGAEAESAPNYSAGLARVFEGEDAYGVVVADVIWTFAAGDPKVIPLCWENPETKYQEAMAWVEDSVKTTWGSAPRRNGQPLTDAEQAARGSSLVFVFDQSCAGTDASKSVRIQIEDSRKSPRTRALGKELLGVENGVQLNFEFEKLQQTCCTNLPLGWPYEDCRRPTDPSAEDYALRMATHESCVRATAIHEFGHVVAFAHEQKHPGTPEECHNLLRDQLLITDSRLEGSEVAVTARNDPLSVMNYCRKDRMSALELSDLDQKTLHALYCRRGVDSCTGYTTALIGSIE